ncbi:ABC transporter ATP-binding protein [Enterococcus camelliae]|uniref:ABC transporter ATP-binding protein n=1 Tax=Enterococcus camelliae TaxID=453959 RepID=A0ABW5TIS8_9ENTE
MKGIQSLLRLFRYLNPYKFRFALVVLLTLVSVALNAALPYVIGLPTSAVAKSVLAGQPIQFEYIRNLLGWILFVGLGYGVSQLLAGTLMTTVVQSAMKDLRQEIDQKINRLPVAYFDRQKQGDILSRVTNDVDAVGGALQQAFIGIASALLSLTFAIGMMFYIQPLMASIALLMIPASFLISRTIVKKSQKYFNEMQQSLGTMNGFVQENMTGFSVLKMYGREEQTFAGFHQVNHRLRHFGFRATVISGLMMPLVQLTAYLTYIVMAVMGIRYVILGTLLVGQLQAFIQYIWQVSQPLGNITQLSSLLQSASAASKRVFTFLDESEESIETETQHFLAPIQGEVIFDNVSFAYTPEKPLIQSFNLHVKPGQTVAIVGPTGAGKTTLINLLMRFYDVTHGAIKIDGIDSRNVSRKEVRSLFGMVLQDAWLYEGTIADNIRFGRLAASDYEVVDAAKAANVDHFIRTMPNGYEMVINAEGENVSLGQKQLLTIARAILANPKILILDEATSSVDTRIEQLIQKAMETMMQGRTSFIIAHRLSTIRSADLILVLNKGQIVEQGTHETLLAKNGFYSELYNSQFAEDQ